MKRIMHVCVQNAVQEAGDASWQGCRAHPHHQLRSSGEEMH